MESVLEARRITKVNSKGVKRKRVKCKKGYKLSSSGKSCVPITGAEKAKKRKSIKKAIRTKNQKGAGYKKRTKFRKMRAMQKRKNYGLK